MYTDTGTVLSCAVSDLEEKETDGRSEWCVGHPAGVLVLRHGLGEGGAWNLRGGTAGSGGAPAASPARGRRRPIGRWLAKGRRRDT